MQGSVLHKTNADELKQIYFVSRTLNHAEELY